MKNMDLFNLSVAKIFSQCYQSFPIPTKLEVLDIGAQVKNLLNQNSEVIDPSEIEYQVVIHAIKWLEKSGYIWLSRSVADLEFNHVVLTPKGLEVLNAIPSELENKETFGDIFSKSAKEMAADSILNLVKTALTTGLTLIATNV